MKLMLSLGTRTSGSVVRIGNPTTRGQVWHGLDVPKRPRTLKFEPPNHWIGQAHRRENTLNPSHTQTYSAAYLNRRFVQSPIDTLIDIKVRCGLRCHIPIRLDFHPGLPSAHRSRPPIPVAHINTLRLFQRQVWGRQITNHYYRFVS